MKICGKNEEGKENAEWLSDVKGHRNKVGNKIINVHRKHQSIKLIFPLDVEVAGFSRTTLCSYSFAEEKYFYYLYSDKYI